MPVNLPPGLQWPANALGEKAIQAVSAILHIPAEALTNRSAISQAEDCQSPGSSCSMQMKGTFSEGACRKSLSLLAAVFIFLGGLGRVDWLSQPPSMTQYLNFFF